MNDIWCTIVCFTVTFVSAINAEIDCRHLPNGEYTIGCKTYVRCKNGNATTIECPLNEVYNNLTKQCDVQNHVLPPCGLVKDCTNVVDGSYADLTLNCTSYYTCSHHVYFGHNFCTPGTVFDNTLGTCVWPNDALPPCGTKV